MLGVFRVSRSKVVPEREHRFQEVYKSIGLILLAAASPYPHRQVTWLNRDGHGLVGPSLCRRRHQASGVGGVVILRAEVTNAIAGFKYTARRSENQTEKDLPPKWNFRLAISTRGCNGLFESYLCELEEAGVVGDDRVWLGLRGAGGQHASLLLPVQKRLVEEIHVGQAVVVNVEKTGERDL